MEVANSTGENTEYRVLGAGGGAPPRFPENFWNRKVLVPALSGTLEANTYVELELPPTPCRLQFLREGKVIAECIVNHPAVIVSLVKVRKNVYKPVIVHQGNLLPGIDRAADLQARRNEEARTALLEEFGVLTSAEVAERTGSRASNRAALANRWKQEGRIFSVSYEGATLYPAFQFDRDGQPLPVIARIIGALGGKGNEWQLALWCISFNGWLRDRRPVDLLESEPQAVEEAAERGAEELVF